MADEVLEKEDVSQEDKWQIEDDARTIKGYFEIRSDKDRYNKAINSLKKEDAAVQEALKEASDYKNSIGLSKK